MNTVNMRYAHQMLQTCYMPKINGNATRTKAVTKALTGAPLTSLPSLASKASQALDAYRGNASPELRTELAEAVLTLHAHGQPLVDACRTISRESGHPVSPGMLRSWCADSDRLGPMLVRARELCAEALAESTLAIADEGEDVGRDKLRIDVRRSLAGQYDAARWGQRAAPAVGAVAQASVTVQVGGDLAAVLAAAGATITQK